MTTNNSWDNGSPLPAVTANKTAANIFQITNTLVSTQTITTSTGGGNIFVCTNTSAISITLPAPTSFTGNYIDFIFSSSTFPVTLIAPTGTFNSVSGLASIVIPPNTQSCRVFSSGSGYFILFGLFNGETLPSGLVLPQPVINLTTANGMVVTNSSGVVSAVTPLTQNLIAGSATALVNNIAKDIITVTGLTVGSKWITSGNVTFVNNTGTFSFPQAWVSATSATDPDASLFYQITASASTAGNCGAIAPTQILTVGASGNLFLSCLAAFTVALSACGNIVLIPT